MIRTLSRDEHINRYHHNEDATSNRYFESLFHIRNIRILLLL